MKRRSLLVFFSALVTIIGIGAWVKPVLADGAEFTTTPVFGTGQSDKGLGYYAISAVPGETYPLTINIQNVNTKKSNDFDVTLVSASTSDSGSIDYTPNKQKMVKSKAPMLPDLVEKKDLKQSITLAPGASQKVTFQVKVPKKGFKGLILGSVYVQRTSTHQTSPKKSFGIQNAFAMTTPVLISQDLKNTVMPKLSLTMAKLESSAGGVPAVVGRIENSEPTMFGHIKLNAWVTKKDKSKKLYKKNSENYSMAPRSTFKYTIDTNNELLPKGEYTYHVKMVSGKKTFNLKRNFTVDGATREQVNKELSNPEKPGPNWWLWGSLIVLLVLVIALIAYLFGRKRGAGEHDA